MLNIRELVKGYNRTSRSFQELLPFMCMWDEKTIATLDQGMLALFTYTGLDAEGRSDDEASAAVDSFERAFSDFGTGSTVWTYVDRRRTDSYPKGTFKDQYSQYIDDLWEEIVTSNQYENRYTLAVHQRSNRGTLAFFDAVDLIVREEAVGLGAAFWKALKAQLSMKSRRSLDEKKMKAAHIALEDKIAALESGMRGLGLRRLEGSELLAELHNRVSPASPERTEFPVPKIPAFLSNTLCNDTLDRTPSALVFENKEKKYVGVVSLKGFTDYGDTEVGQLDWLTTIDGEITVAHCFRFMDSDIAEKAIETVEKYNISKSVPFMHRLLTSLAKKEPTKFNAGRQALAQDAELARVELVRSRRAFGHHNLTVLCYGSTYEEMERVRAQVIDNLRHSQFTGSVERMHQLSAFAGTIPGQYAAAVRWNFVSYGNAADIAPIRTLMKGPLTVAHFERELRRSCPALTSVPTTAGTPAFIDLWETGVGHTKIIGPTRAGKSSLTNFLLAQFRKFEPCRTICFDKDFSCQVGTLLQGGVHIDLSPSAANAVRMSPLGLIGDEAHHPFAVTWVVELIESGRPGVICTPQEIDKITRGIRALADLNDPSKYRLKYLAPDLGPDLAAYLGKWIEGGAFGHWFDNEPVEVEMANHICFECRELFTDKTVSSLAMSYLFHIVEGMLDGTPTVVNIEETWYFLENEKFSAKIDNFLRTLGKLNGSLWMVTQTMQEIKDSPIRASILANVKNTIYLPDRNIRQMAELYEEVAGLLPEEIQRIATATEKQHYYFKTPTVTRMLDVRLPEEIINCISASSRVRGIFNKHYVNRESNPAWREDYFKEVMA